MNNSTPRRAKKKPAKPDQGYPLFAHNNGSWAKKIRGKLHYFGPWDDPAGALQRYLDQKDDLHAGRPPRAARGGLPLRDLVNRFLTDRRYRVDSGELTLRSWQDYHRICDRLIHVLGRDTLVEDLRPEDFTPLRSALARTLGPAALTAAISRIRVLFNYGFQNGLIDKPVRFGTALERPPKRLLRQARNGKGSRMFQADEIRMLIDAAGPTMRAMLYLGINCGLGPADLGRMTEDVLDLSDGCLEFPRPKTGIPRRCPLWAETVAAIKEAIAQRAKPKTEALIGRVFLTERGGAWFVDTVDGPISKAMGRLMKRAGVYRQSRGFYGLRRSFRTVADEVKDPPAIDHIMGHSDNSMASHYRERISDDRLQAVVDHVHGWLFPETEGGSND